MDMVISVFATHTSLRFAQTLVLMISLLVLQRADAVWASPQATKTGSFSIDVICPPSWTGKSLLGTGKSLLPVISIIAAVRGMSAQVRELPGAGTAAGSEARAVVTSDITQNPAPERELTKFLRNPAWQRFVQSRFAEATRDAVLEDLRTMVSEVQLKSIFEDLVNRLTVPSTVNFDETILIDRLNAWIRFNGTHLLPHFYGAIEVYEQGGRIQPLFSLYAISRIQLISIGGTGWANYYGYRLNNPSVDTGRSSVFDVNIFDLNGSEVQSRILINRIREALTQSDPTTRAINERFKGIFNHLLSIETRVPDLFLLLSVAHENAHQMQRLLKIKYQGRDQFGIPRDVWDKMTANQKLQIERELVGPAAEILALTDKFDWRFSVIPLGTMMHALTVGDKTSYLYWISAWWLNKLAGMPDGQWIYGDDEKGRMLLWNRIAAWGDKLPARVRELLSQHYPRLEILANLPPDFVPFQVVRNKERIMGLLLMNLSPNSRKNRPTLHILSAA